MTSTIPILGPKGFQSHEPSPEPAGVRVPGIGSALMTPSAPMGSPCHPPISFPTRGTLESLGTQWVEVFSRRLMPFLDVQCLLHASIKRQRSTSPRARFRRHRPPFLVIVRREGTPNHGLHVARTQRRSLHNRTRVHSEVLVSGHSADHSRDYNGKSTRRLETHQWRRICKAAASVLR